MLYQGPNSKNYSAPVRENNLQYKQSSLLQANAINATKYQMLFIIEEYQHQKRRPSQTKIISNKNIALHLQAHSILADCQYHRILGKKAFTI